MSLNKPSYNMLGQDLHDKIGDLSQTNYTDIASGLKDHTSKLAEIPKQTFLPYEVIPNIYWISTTGMDTRLTTYINLCKTIGITKVILNIQLIWVSANNDFEYAYSIINTTQATLEANGITVHAIKFGFDKQATLDPVLSISANQTALQNKIVSTVQTFGALDHVVVYNEVPYFYGNSRTVSSNLQMCINTVNQLNGLGYKTLIAFQEVTDLLTTDLSLVNLLGGIGINHYPSLSFKKVAITESEAVKGFPNTLRFDAITSVIFNYTGKDKWYLTEIGVMDAWESMQDPVNWELGSQSPSTSSGGQTNYLMIKALFEATKNKDNLLEVNPWWFDSWNGTTMKNLFSQYVYNGGIQS